MKHGTASSYQRHKCRCEPCTKANSAHKASWKARKREAVYPLHRQARQWPLAELLAVVPDARTRLPVDSVQWARARDHGMSDRVADQWAVACGVHPGSVYTGWFERGLSALDALHVYGSDTAVPGWRQAYEWSEAG